MPASLVAFGDRHLGAMPYLLVAPLIVALLLGVFFSRAPPGRRLLAFGGNPQAAELSGISGERVVVSAHVLSGLLAAAAAVLAVAQSDRRNRPLALTGCFFPSPRRSSAARR